MRPYLSFSLALLTTLACTPVPTQECVLCSQSAIVYGRVTASGGVPVARANVYVSISTFSCGSVVEGQTAVLSSTDQTVDLASVSGANAPQSLGQSTVPSGRVTQIRLELAPGQDNGDGTSRLPGAVTTGSETCDLIVPASAFSPGLKILTPFRAENGTQNVATVLLDLRDSSRLGTASCAYFLNPVLQLEKVDTTRAPQR